MEQQPNAEQNIQMNNGESGEILPESKPVRRFDWRWLIAGTALVVIGVLGYPFWSGGQTSVQPTDRPASAASKSAENYFKQGNEYVQNGRWAEAVDAYRQAIALDPNFQPAYVNLGVAYYQLGQFDLAAAQYEKALELVPDDNETAYNLGALYLQQALSAGSQPDADLLRQAVAHLEGIRERDPDIVQTYFSLGVAYFFLGQKEAAVQAFETFLERGGGQDERA
ncbi:MAG: tetratricopeptide repeat protein, partial [Chloroflexi bacterium]